MARKRICRCPVVRSRRTSQARRPETRTLEKRVQILEIAFFLACYSDIGWDELGRFLRDGSPDDPLAAGHFRHAN